MNIVVNVAVAILFILCLPYSCPKIKSYLDINGVAVMITASFIY
ncbi:hypothetical protein ACFLR6_00175 [Campylobacterota bacterium]